MSLKTNTKDKDESALLSFQDEHMKLVSGIDNKKSKELVNVLESNLIKKK